MATRRMRTGNPADPPAEGVESVEEHVDVQQPEQEAAAPASAVAFPPGGPTLEEQIMTDFQEDMPEEFLEPSALEEACELHQVRLEQTVAYFAARLDEVEDRLHELEAEWDLDQTMMATTACASGAGALLAILGARKWLLLPVAAAGFMLQHAVTGWCPIASLLYRMGVRTSGEIDQERVALKALRGDFRQLKNEGDCVSQARAAIQASETNLA